MDYFSFHSIALISLVMHSLLVIGTYVLLSKCSAKDNSFLKSYFSNGGISNSIFLGEALFF